MNKSLLNTIYGAKVRPGGLYGPRLVEKRFVDDGFGNLVQVTVELPRGLAFMEFDKDRLAVILDTQLRL